MLMSSQSHRLDKLADTRKILHPLQSSEKERDKTFAAMVNTTAPCIIRCISFVPSSRPPFKGNPFLANVCIFLVAMRL